jgi:hypothetical protein
MIDNSQMNSTERLRRSCIYAIVAVSASTAAVIGVAVLGSRNTAQNSGTNVTDVVSYVLAVPLIPGWFPIRGMFDRIGSCSSLGQFLGTALVVPMISVVIDTGLIFGVWELLHRKMTQGLESDRIFHIDR